MPDTVSGMDVSAFQGCTNLTSVKLSAGLENISSKAFYGCTKLASIEIGGFVSSIGDEAFYNCTALTSVTLPDGLVTIGNKAFYGAKLVKEIILPESLETIGDYAFYDWSSLEKVDVPARVTSIGAYAFSGCVNVTELNLPEGSMLVSVGDYAFENMTKLTSFFIPANLTDVGQGIFKGWDNLEDITVEGGNLEYAYENGILYNATYTEMVLITPKAKGTLKVPETVTTLAKGVFAGLALERVELPDTLTEIPDEAFRGCTQLVSVKMPRYLEKIGVAAFEGCVSLKSIDIPETVHSTFEKKESVEPREGMLMGYYVTEMADGIGKYAFANCTSLASVNFVSGGSRRLSFGDYAFYNCTSLTSMSIPNRVRSQAALHYNTEGADMQGITDYYSQSYNHGIFEQGIGMYCFAMCTNLKTVVFEEATDNLTFVEGLVIRVGAFTGCTALETVQLSSAIYDYQEIMVGKGGREEVASIMAIQGRAFEGCTALKDVTFVQTDHPVTVRETAFKDSKIELPKFVIVDTSTITTAEKQLFLYGCASCAISTSNPGGECASFNPVGDGVVEGVDPLRNLVVEDAQRTWADGKPCKYVFNGLDTEYGNAKFEQATNMNMTTKYNYSYKVISYNAETGIVTLEVIGTNSQNSEYNKKYSATVNLNTKTFTRGNEIK